MTAVMGGICGWVEAGSVPGRRTDPVDTRSPRRSMQGALAHRGAIEWLDWSVEPEASPGPVVADTFFNGRAMLADSWAASSADPVTFATTLRGAFAVAALDRAGGRLHLVRDRLGEKPLYYTLSPSGIAFASEIKALRSAGVLPDRTLLPEAVDSFLAFTYIPAPWTIFRHVRRVPAGHCVEIDLAKLAAHPEQAARTRRYWELPDREGTTASPREMLDHLAEALDRILPGDGRVAVFLSGGLDSSLVATLLKRRLGESPPTFSVTFTGRGLDESVHARRVARLLGSRHHEINLDVLDAELACRVIEQLDEPMADAATLPTFVLAQAASEVARVVITGDGADALLAGDHWFRRVRRLASLERKPPIVRGLLPWAGAVVGRRSYARYRDLVRLLDKPPGDRYLAIRQKWTRRERWAAYSPAFAAGVDASKTADTYRAGPGDRTPGDPVEAAMRTDACHGLPEDLLMKADKMCAAHGLDARSPFLDTFWVEWTARLRMDLHLRRSMSKYLLKKAAEAVLPRDLVYRSKHGLQTPLRRWMRGPLKGLVEDAFDRDQVERSAIFDHAALAELRERFEHGRPHPAVDGKMWQIVVFQTWWRQVFG
ncbi:MAG: asparagine synthetase B family protein [Acidobacteriota bacterium]